VEDDTEREVVSEFIAEAGLQRYHHIGNDLDNNDPSYDYQLYDADESEIRLLRSKSH
jgi:hypothetical protein